MNLVWTLMGAIGGLCLVAIVAISVFGGGFFGNLVASNISPMAPGTITTGLPDNTSIQQFQPTEAKMPYYVATRLTGLPPLLQTQAGTSIPVLSTKTILSGQMQATQTPVVNQASSNSSKIAFVSDRDGNNEIYVMDINGQNQTNLTHNQADDLSPAWSPDGSQIAFVSNRDGNGYEIYVMNADGSQPTRLTDGPPNHVNPAWSPDGKTIAFSSNMDGLFGIYVMNADGTHPTRLTNNPARNTNPTWLADGGKLAFDSFLNGSFNILIMNPDGSHPIPITNQPYTYIHPVWSPDGQKIAFETDRDGGSEIYLMDIHGANEIRLTHSSTLNNFDLGAENPAWSADGMKIAYDSNPDGQYNIYIMDANGQNQVPLTHSPGNNSSPALFPVSVSAPGALTSNLFPPTPQAAVEATSPAKILAHTQTFTTFKSVELWLEFTIAPQQNLTGAQMEAYLSDGALQIELPTHEKKSYPQIPSPSDITSLKDATFTNENQTTMAGPQVKIAFGMLVQNPVKGEYHITWNSKNLQSNTIVLNWDGQNASINP